MPISGIGRIDDARPIPNVGAWIVPSARVHAAEAEPEPAPHNHFTVAPDCSGSGSGIGRAGGGCGCPTVGARIVSSAGIEIGGTALHVISSASAPDDHFTASRNCYVPKSSQRRASGADRCPTVGARIVSSARIQGVAVIVNSAPDDHFAASQHREVTPSAVRRTKGVSRGPTVGDGVVPPARVKTGRWRELMRAAPNDHFAASPHRRVKASAVRRTKGVSRGPTVRDGVVPPASVKPSLWEAREAMKTAPDNHFATGPYCRVISSLLGRVG